ncbi:hypothetical protein ABT297_26220 [Dactylosporangium sp. NPDC000555]|uniref:hypothetical protein n=1 Tax=Dactylosporangium sp. NPDC000555 TaxID=3154260 RepID=UPI0033169DB6
MVRIADDAHGDARDLIDLVTAWDRLHRAGVRPAVTVHPVGAALTTTEQLRLLVARHHTQIVITWPRRTTCWPPGRTKTSAPQRGPFLSLGVPVWAAWLLAVVVHVVAPGRWFRWAVGFAVLVTAGVAMLTETYRPPLFVLLPQVMLGIVALGAAGRQPWWVRLIPLAAAAASVPIAASTAPRFVFSGDDYYKAAVTALPAAAVTLLIGTRSSSGSRRPTVSVVQNASG